MQRSKINVAEHRVPCELYTHERDYEFIHGHGLGVEVNEEQVCGITFPTPKIDPVACCTKDENLEIDWVSNMSNNTMLKK